ncbi:MAG: response regulator [Thermodesulfobacteriota bacterium]
MRKIAVIDDDASGRLVLKGLLEERGLSVVAEGGSGDEALGICRDFSPDVVVMDVKMPGVDGIEAAAEIARHHPTPVVLLTASEDEETVSRAAGAGIMAYLVKPVRGEELLPAVELAVARFREFEKLKKENEDLKDTLAARKLVERAKGLLMERDGISESEAFTRIQKISMDRRKPMKEVAEIVIAALEGLG